MTMTRHSRPASGASKGLGQGGLWVVQPRPRSRHRYCGKEKDAESGLYYYSARYYESWTCRFVSVGVRANGEVGIVGYNISVMEASFDAQAGLLESTVGSMSTKNLAHGINPDFLESLGGEFFATATKATIKSNVRIEE